jgi:hypothetical protein
VTRAGKQFIDLIKTAWHFYNLVYLAQNTKNICGFFNNYFDFEDDFTLKKTSPTRHLMNVDLLKTIPKNISS